MPDSLRGNEKSGRVRRMARLNNKARAEHTYDAIVVGSGITGGYAAMELTKKGLRTLVLERGPMVRHIADYPTANTPPWGAEYPRGQLPPQMLDAVYPMQKRTGYAVTEYSKHFFVKDHEDPYTETQRFDWIRGYHVGGRSLTWGRQTYRHSDLDFEANAKQGIGADWPIRYADLEPWYDRVETFIGVSGQAEGLPQLPDGKFQPPMEMNCVERAFKAKSEARYPERRITIGRAAHLTAPTAEQIALGRSKCQNRNLCVRGCPFGAYFSSNSATLVAAERTGHLTIRPNSIVTSLIENQKVKRADGVKVLDAETGEEVEFFAKVIFLNASSIATAWVLLNSASPAIRTASATGATRSAATSWTTTWAWAPAPRSRASRTCTIRAAARTASMCRASATSATRPPRGRTTSEASATRAARPAPVGTVAWTASAPWGRRR